MPLYVLALTDTDLGSWTTGGRSLNSASFGEIHVVHERRTAGPIVSDEELRAQHGLVMAIAERAPAVLPARFGALLEKRELAAVISRHHDVIVAAFDQVRDHVQMTIRVLGTRAAPAAAAPSAATMTGTDYLRRARLAAIPPMTLVGERVLAAVAPMVAAERRVHGTGGLLATIYHLVDVRQVGHYVDAIGPAVTGVIVSGPWPPFAFAPQLW